MKFYFLFFTFLFLCIPTKVKAQNDTLDIFLLRKMNSFKNINLDSALFYCNKLKRSKDICRRLEAFTSESHIFQKQKQYKKSENLLIHLNKKIDSLIQKEDNSCFVDRKIAIQNRLFWIKKKPRKLY